MNRLKELRKEKGLTQQGLADIVGVTKRTIIAWENRERDIKTDKAQQLADYFGVSVGYLLGFSSDKFKVKPSSDFGKARDEKEEERAKYGYDKLITISGITDMSAFTERLALNMDVEAVLKNMSPLQLLKLSKDKKAQEKIANLQLEKVKDELENIAIALSYLGELESEILSLFYVLSKQDKETILRMAKAFADPNTTDG